MSNLKGIGHGHGGPPGLGSDGPPGRAVGLRGDNPPGAGRGPAISPNADPVTQLSQLAQTVSPAEVPQALPPDLRSVPQPDLREGYNPHALLNTDAQLRGEGALVQKPVQDLVPDLRQANTLSDVRERFSTDYSLLKPQLVDVPHLDAQEKAQRAFQFFAAYASQFVAVATGQPQHLPSNAPPPDPTALQQNNFQDEAPVQATGEESQLWEGDGSDASELGGRLGRLLEKSARGPRDPGSLRAGREGRAGLADALPFAPVPQEPFQVPDRATLRSETQAFAQVLKDLHFEALHDEATGKSGLQLAYELLTSKSPEELARKADGLQLRAEEWPPSPPSADPSRAPEDPAAIPDPTDAFSRPLVKKDLGESRPELDNRVEYERMNGSPEPQPLRVQPWATEAGKVLIQPAADRSPRPIEGDDRAWLGRLTDKKLGRNMLWNVLHRFRGQGADSAVEKGEWDKLTFGAILVLVLIVLIVIALVAL